MLPLNPNEAYSQEVYRQEEQKRRDSLGLNRAQPQKDFKKIIDSPQNTTPDEKEGVKDSSTSDIALDEETKQEVKTTIDTARANYQAENEPVYIELTPEQMMIINKLKTGNQAFNMSEEAENAQQLNELLLELSIEKLTESQKQSRRDTQISLSKSAIHESLSSPTPEKASYYLSISPEQARKLKDLVEKELKLGGENRESLTAAVDLFQSLSASAQKALSSTQISNKPSPEALQKGDKALDLQSSAFGKTEKSKTSPFLEEFFGAKNQAQSGRVRQDSTATPSPFQSLTESYKTSPLMKKRAEESANAGPAKGTISQPVSIELTSAQAETINELKSLVQASSMNNPSEMTQKLNTLLQELQPEKTSKIESAKGATGLNAQNDYYLEISPEQAKQLQEFDIGSLPVQSDSQRKSVESAIDLFKGISTTANDLLNKQELPSASSTTTARPITEDFTQRPSPALDLPADTPAAYEQRAPTFQPAPATPFASDQFASDISSLEQSIKGGGTTIGNVEAQTTREPQAIEKDQALPKPLEAENFNRPRSAQAELEVGQRIPADLKPEGLAQSVEGQQLVEKTVKEENLRPSSLKLRSPEQMPTNYDRGLQEAQLAAAPLSTNFQKDASLPSNVNPRNQQDTLIKTQPLEATTGVTPQPEEIRNLRQIDKSSSDKKRSTEAEAAAASSMAPPPLQSDIPIQVQTIETKGPSKEETVRLINELVDQIAIIKNNGQTDTLVTLRSPKILEGSTIKISTYDQARGEVNITFANLTPEAKKLLDDNLAKESLTDTLKNRTDIVVHNIITTTQEEIPVYTEPKLRERGQEEGKQQDRDRDRGE